MKSKIIKLILINVGVTFGLIFSINFLINLIELVVPAVNISLSKKDPNKIHGRALLPNYKNDVESASVHFREFGQLSTEYQPFIAWSRVPFSGETITINQAGDRVHHTDKLDPESSESIYFFGGSTMWGTGVNDNQTIPAYFQTISQIKTINKGEAGHVSRQSLAAFINLLASNSKINTVVFYDGVNDVQFNCRADVGINGHVRASKFRKAIDNESKKEPDRLRSEQEQFLIYLDQVFTRELRDTALDIAEELFPRRKEERIDKSLNCDNSPEIARQVAEAMVLNWEIAYSISHTCEVQSFRF